MAKQKKTKKQAKKQEEKTDAEQIAEYASNMLELHKVEDVLLRSIYKCVTKQQWMSKWIPVPKAPAAFAAMTEGKGNNGKAQNKQKDEEAGEEKGGKNRYGTDRRICIEPGGIA